MPRPKVNIQTSTLKFSKNCKLCKGKIRIFRNYTKISLFCQEKTSLLRKFYLKSKRCQEKKDTRL